MFHVLFQMHLKMRGDFVYLCVAGLCFDEIDMQLEKFLGFAVAT